MASTSEDKPVHRSGTIDIGGRTVHRLGYGAMQLTGKGVWGDPPDRERCVQVLRRARDLGVTFIDTADSYGPYVSEEIIREALHPYGEVLVATKAGLVRTGPGEWHPVGRPEYLRQECEMSIRRLGVEALDLFQLHRVDPKVPAEEQFGLLRDLLDEGKIRAAGLSEVSVEQIEEARQIVPIASVQNLYNLAERRYENVLEHCERNGICFIPWFPLASGSLAREGGVLQRVAHDVGASVAQVAIAWLLARSPVMAPIPGTASLEHVEENCRAATITLTEEHVRELDEASLALSRQ